MEKMSFGAPEESMVVEAESEKKYEAHINAPKDDEELSSRAVEREMI